MGAAFGGRRKLQPRFTDFRAIRPAGHNGYKLHLNSREQEGATEADRS